MPSPTPEQSAIEAITAYLLRRHGPGVILRAVSLEIVAGGMVQEITFRPGSLAAVPCGQTEGRQETDRVDENRPITPTMQRILSVLGEANRPLKGETVARRAGKNYTGHFRTALHQLRERELILLLDEGYWLAGRER